MGKKIRVFVICPHALVREGLCALIQQQRDLQVVASAADGSDVTQRMEALAPDVVVVDAEAAPNLESLSDFIERCAPRHVLILTQRVEHHELLAVLRANAKGYLPLDATPAELINAIRTTSRGELALHATAARVLVESSGKDTLVAHGAVGFAPEGLTERERQVLRWLCEGCSNKQIAQKLFISVRTVEGRLNTIYSKLGVHSRAEVIIAAARMGWIPRED